MNTSRDLVINALCQQSVERIPRDVVDMTSIVDPRAEEVTEVSRRYPSDILRLESPYPVGLECWGVSPHRSSCTAGPPLATRADIVRFDPPFDLFPQVAWEDVERQCDRTSQFVLAPAEFRPLDRLSTLLGESRAERALMEGVDEVERLLGRIHEFLCLELRLWLEMPVDGIVIRDDLGDLAYPRLDPRLWHDVFEPLYAEYAAMAREQDKFVFFETSEAGELILDELVDMEIDAVSLPMTIDGLERFAGRYRGEITFCGEISDPRIGPDASCEDLRDAIFQARQLMDFGAGGMIAKVPWTTEMPRSQVVSMLDHWSTPMPMHAWGSGQ